MTRNSSRKKQPQKGNILVPKWKDAENKIVIDFKFKSTDVVSNDFHIIAKRTAGIICASKTVILGGISYHKIETLCNAEKAVLKAMTTLRYEGDSKEWVFLKNKKGDPLNFLCKITDNSHVTTKDVVDKLLLPALIKAKIGRNAVSRHLGYLYEAAYRWSSLRYPKAVKIGRRSIVNGSQAFGFRGNGLPRTLRLNYAGAMSPIAMHDRFLRELNRIKALDKQKVGEGKGKIRAAVKKKRKQKAPGRIVRFRETMKTVFTSPEQHALLDLIQSNLSKQAISLFEKSWLIDVPIMSGRVTIPCTRYSSYVDEPEIDVNLCEGICNPVSGFLNHAYVYDFPYEEIPILEKYLGYIPGNFNDDIKKMKENQYYMSQNLVSVPEYMQPPRREIGFLLAVPTVKVKRVRKDVAKISIKTLKASAASLDAIARKLKKKAGAPIIVGDGEDEALRDYSHHVYYGKNVGNTPMEIEDDVSPDDEDEIVLDEDETEQVD